MPLSCSHAHQRNNWGHSIELRKDLSNFDVTLCGQATQRWDIRQYRRLKNIVRDFTRTGLFIRVHHADLTCCQRAVLRVCRVDCASVLPSIREAR